MASWKVMRSAWIQSFIGHSPCSLLLV